MDLADIESPPSVEQSHVLEQHCSCLLPLALRHGLCDMLWPLGGQALTVHIGQCIWNLACTAKLLVGMTTAKTLGGL